MAKVPHFDSIMEESDFWDTHSPLDYPDELETVDVIFVDKRPKPQIELRLDGETFEQLKQLAMKKGKDYRTLARQWVLEGLQKELASDAESKAESQ